MSYLLEMSEFKSVCFDIKFETSVQETIDIIVIVNTMKTL